MTHYLITPDLKAISDTPQPKRSDFKTIITYLHAVDKYNKRNKYEIGNLGEFEVSKGMKVEGFLRNGVFFIETILNK